MAISLKEAIDNSEININELEAENQKQKEKELKAITEKLDRLISANILVILQKPIALNFPTRDLLKYTKEISDMYKDFTISASYWFEVVHIKLSDKNWDWNGYGVNEDDLKQEEKPKQSVKSKRLFSWFKKK